MAVEFIPREVIEITEEYLNKKYRRTGVIGCIRDVNYRNRQNEQNYRNVPPVSEKVISAFLKRVYQCHF